MTRVKQERPEHDEQVMLFNKIEEYRDEYPVLASIFAVPNGEYRPQAVGARLKAEGLQAGVLDICVPVPRVWNEDDGTNGIEITTDDWYYAYVTPGLWVEIKAPGKCVGSTLGTSPEQRVWATIFSELGWQVVVVDTWEQAWFEVLSYLGLTIKGENYANLC